MCVGGGGGGRVPACVRACVCVCVRACVRAYDSVCGRAYVRTCMSVRVCVTSTYTCMPVCVFVITPNCMSIISTRVCMYCLVVYEHDMICVYVCINVHAKLMYRRTLCTYLGSNKHYGYAYGWLWL